MASGEQPHESDVLPPEDVSVCIRCREVRRVRTVLRVDASEGFRARLVTIATCACGSTESDT